MNAVNNKKAYGIKAFFILIAVTAVFALACLMQSGYIPAVGAVEAAETETGFIFEDGILTFNTDSDYVNSEGTEAYKAETTQIVINGTANTIKTDTFKDFPLLKAVMIETDTVTIEDGAFSNCPELKSVLVNNGSIHNTAFQNCFERIYFYYTNSIQTYPDPVPTELYPTSDNLPYRYIRCSYRNKPYYYSNYLYFWNPTQHYNDIQYDKDTFLTIIKYYLKKYDNIEEVAVDIDRDGYTSYNYIAEDLSKNTDLYFYRGANIEKIDRYTIGIDKIYPVIYENGEYRKISYNELFNSYENKEFYLTVDNPEFLSDNKQLIYLINNNDITIQYIRRSLEVDPSYRQNIIIPEEIGGYPVTTLSSSLMYTYRLSSEPPTVTIPKTVVNINSFSSNNFGTIIVSEENPTLYTDKNGALIDRNKQKLICYPAGITEKSYVIPEGITEISNYAFYGHKYLKEISMPTTLKHIGESAFIFSDIRSIDLNEGLESMGEECFYYCTNLAAVTIPSTLNTIPSRAFSSCKKLETVTVSEGVTTIDSYSFMECSALKTVYLPTTVKTINMQAFSWCDSLTDIFYAGSEEDWNSIDIHKSAFGGSQTPIITYNAKVPTEETLDCSFENGVLIISGEGEIADSDINSLHFYDEYKENTVSVILSGNISYVGEYAFNGFPNAELIIFNTENTALAENFVYGCPALKNIVFLGNADFSKISEQTLPENVQIFTEKTDIQPPEAINANIKHYSYDGSVLSFEEQISFSSYSLFDTTAALCMKYENVEKLKFSSVTLDGLPIYYIPEGGASLKQVENSTLTDSEIYPLYKGEKITFNTLTEGINNGSITDFNLVINDKEHSNIVDTPVTVADVIKQIIARAIRWIVTLLNKLFALLSKIKNS